MNSFSVVLMVFGIITCCTTKSTSLEQNSNCGTIPYPSNTGIPPKKPILHSRYVWNFVSEPHLHPMKVSINVDKPGVSDGLIFVAPYTFSADSCYGQPGSLIMDNEGNPIWFRPMTKPNLMNTDFRVQTLNGKSVLTFWQGTLATPPTYTNSPGGSSEPGSCYYILDNTYKVIGNIKAHRGYISDIHEFLLTPNNTALLLSTKAIPMDLTPYGGPQQGYVQDFAIQEIDIETNKLLFFWNALAHIPLTDSYQPASSATSSGNVWDAYHLNAIGLTDSDNNILVSGRNTWTVYKIHKPTKTIIWRLGGKQSDFVIESGAEFSWQHDTRFLPDNTISMFDDNCCESSIPPGTPPAHGLILHLNLITMTATLDREYYHDPNVQVSSQGNIQSLQNGNKFIGWGQSHYYSEFAQAGNTINDPALNLLYDAQMPGNNYTYRAYRNTWIGTPYYPPSMVVNVKDKQAIVYVSWNGSTETTAWQLLAGACVNTLTIVKTVPKNGFETIIHTTNQGPVFQVNALDVLGNVIGTSNVVSIGIQSELEQVLCQKYC